MPGKEELRNALKSDRSTLEPGSTLPCLSCETNMRLSVCQRLSRSKAGLSAQSHLCRATLLSAAAAVTHRGRMWFPTGRCAKYPASRGAQNTVTAAKKVTVREAFCSSSSQHGLERLQQELTRAQQASLLTNKVIHR